jgi:Flp pilus assembly pilin Flp
VRARTQVRPSRERAARKSRARRSPLAGSAGRRSLSDATGSALVEYLVLVGVVALLALQAFSIFGQGVSGTVGQEGADVAKLGF